jgi:hypothetical protein
MPKLSGYIFPRNELCINFDKNMGWATFWANLSKTHLVTLLFANPEMNKIYKQKQLNGIFSNHCRRTLEKKIISLPVLQPFSIDKICGKVKYI